MAEREGKISRRTLVCSPSRTKTEVGVEIQFFFVCERGRERLCSGHKKKPREHETEQLERERRVENGAEREGEEDETLAREKEVGKPPKR